MGETNKLTTDLTGLNAWLKAIHEISLRDTKIDDEPSLTHSDESSQEDSMYDEFDSKTKSRQTRISWNPEVEVREYVITMGDHPKCVDGCPLSLDWEYDTRTKDVAFSQERQSAYRIPKRLTLRERRRKLYGDIKEDMTENLRDFAIADANLDDMLRELDVSLTKIAIAPVPQFTLPSSNASPSSVIRRRRTTRL